MKKKESLVFRKHDKKLYVAAAGGAIIIGDVFGQSGEKINHKVKLGARFFTPSSFLEKARAAKPIHKANGIRIREF